MLHQATCVSGTIREDDHLFKVQQFSDLFRMPFYCHACCFYRFSELHDPKHGTVGKT